MGALLIKDFYTLNKQLRLYILILVAFVAFNQEFSAVFLPVWCSMLPYTSIAYDEQSKWDNLAGMMPYSIRALVLSKYVFGWICVAVITLLMVAFQIVLSLAGPFQGPDYASIAIGVCIGACVMACSLPAIFRFGVERGRMLMFLLIFVVCGSAGGIVFVADKVPVAVPVLLMGAPVLALALSLLSVPLSMKAYAKRRQ